MSSLSIPTRGYYSAEIAQLIIKFMSQTYTPTTDTNPTFGQSGDTVSALQTHLNEVNKNAPGWTPLAVDGKFGPLTQAAVNFKPQSQLVVTSNAADMAHTKYSGQLDEALSRFNLNGNTQDSTKIDPATYSDAFTKQLDQQFKSSNEATKAMIQSLQTKTQAKQTALAGQYDNYKRGLQMLGIQHNQAQATPDLLLGHEQQAQNDYNTKVNTLDTELHKALIDAQAARDSKDTQQVKTKMDYIKSIYKEKDNALKEVYTSLTQQKSAANIEAHLLYDSISKLKTDDEKEQMILAAARKYQIPATTLHQALLDEGAKRSKGSGRGSGKVKANVKDITDQLDASIKQPGTLGTDGFMDPQRWIETRDKWIKNRLPESTFNKLYKRYLNPECYDLAGFSKKSTGSGGRKA